MRWMRGLGLLAETALWFWFLGLLVLLGAPAIGLAYLVVALFRAKDRLHALLALIVLGILAISIVFKGIG